MQGVVDRPDEGMDVMSEKLDTHERMLLGFCVMLVIGVLAGFVSFAAIDPFGALTVLLTLGAIPLVLAVFYVIGAAIDKWGPS